jgi:uncharacterized phage protein (TIGR02216 family)|tara:strand:+ start:920 stop:1132 length:213 start_codon:yes stop_codon:yes gene_type:complete
VNTQPIQWSDYVKICIGMMNMRPSDFWSLSPREMYLAISGFKTFHASGQDKEEPMDSERLQEMMELYPDG